MTNEGKAEKIVLGIDPGTNVMGYGLLRVRGNKAMMVAMGVIRALSDLGRRVPEDVSVFGFDGTEMGKFFIPRLTTVEQPVEDIARESVRVLMDMLQNDAPPSDVVVEGIIRLRESVR